MFPLCDSPSVSDRLSTRHTGEDSSLDTREKIARLPEVKRTPVTVYMHIILTYFRFSRCLQRPLLIDANTFCKYVSLFHVFALFQQVTVQVTSYSTVTVHNFCMKRSVRRQAKAILILIARYDLFRKLLHLFPYDLFPYFFRVKP